MLTNDPRFKFSERPRFRLGEKFVPILQPIKPSLPVKVRKRDPEGRIRRPAFMKEGPKARALETIEEIQKLRTRQLGIKVRLGDEKLGKIKVKKRDADGNVILDDQGNPVFEERDISLSSLAEIMQESATDNIARLDVITTSIAAGASVSKRERDEITVRLIAIASDVEDLSRFTSTQFAILGRAISAAGIPSNPVAAGITNLVDGRFITRAGWEADGGANKATILLFLMANVREKPGLSIERPVFGISGNTNTISTILSTMSGTRRGIPTPVLDVVDKIIYRTLPEARANVGVPSVPGFVAPGRPAIGDVKEELDVKIPDLPGGPSAADVVGALEEEALELPPSPVQLLPVALQSPEEIRELARLAALR